MYPNKPRGNPGNKNRNKANKNKGSKKQFRATQSGDGGSSQDSSVSSFRGSFIGRAQLNRPNQFGQAPSVDALLAQEEYPTNLQWNRPAQNRMPVELTGYQNRMSVQPAGYQNSNMYRSYTPNSLWYPNQPQYRQQQTPQNINYYSPHRPPSSELFKRSKFSPKRSNGDKDSHLNELPVCPGCSLKFSYILQVGIHIGRVPLILNCKHTLCEECIKRTIKDESVICPVCKNPSKILTNTIDNLQEMFPPNFYVLGVIFWDKYHNNSIDPLALIPVENQTSNEVSLESETQEICCFLQCDQSAVLRCKDCCDIYCSKCCVLMHKNTTSFASHQLISISTGEISTELETCTEHNMETEFFCETCKVSCCCYCFIENHEGHMKQNLAKLSAAETTQLLKYKENAQIILRRLLIAKKKINKLDNYTAMTALSKLSTYFVNLYGRLQIIESNLHKELKNLKNFDKNMMGLNLITPKLNESIRKVKEVLATDENCTNKKINMRVFLKHLEEIQDFPCFLVNEEEDGLDPVDVIVNPVLNNLESYFSIKLCQANKYNLLKESELSAEYRDSLVDMPLSDDGSIGQSTVYSSASKLIKKTKKQLAKGNTASLNREMVQVTHIESLECFYVQLKRFQSQLYQMNNDIKEFIKLASNVENPQTGKLYLAQYTARNQECWCRGRLTEIKNGEQEPLYEIFFIDYGTSQTLDISKLKEITPLLAQRKPFAIQCELYNPALANWSKTAHVYMGKLIYGKDVNMLVKQVHNGIHQVDLMVSSSDRSLTSVVDLMVHTCKNALNTSNSDSSVDSSMNVKPYEFACDHKIYSNSVEFKKNQQEQVIIANIVDPHNIFVHIASHASSLKKMLNAMKIYYKQNVVPVVPTEGNFVVVRHKDKVRGNWHRALVKNIEVEKERVTVLCVDWGLSVVVPWKSVRMLTEQFTKLESQAILVKLAHIEPFNKTGAWSPAANNDLEQKYLLQEVLKMVVVNAEPLEVGLFVKLLTFDMCLNTKLVQENFADSVGKISQTLEWPSTSNEETSSNLSHLAKLDKKVIDESEIEEQDKLLQKEKVEVIKVIDPGTLYVKFLRYQSEAEKLHQELQAHYRVEQTTKESWNVDDLCVVHHDDAYVRGQITSIVGNTQYKVNMYDVGKEDVFLKENLYVPLDYFSQFKNILFKCHLADIRPAGGDNWSKASIEVIENIFESHQHIYFTKAASEDTSVDAKSFPAKMWYSEVQIGGALEASTIKYVSINKILVNLGYAYKLRQSPTNTVKSEIEDNSTPKNWDEMVVEEEKNTTEKKKEDSPYHTYEIDISDWKPAFPIKQTEFKALITCASVEGTIFLREEDLNKAYKDLETNVKEYFTQDPPQIDIEHVWKPGQVCTIEYKGGWYRGKVCGVTHPETDIQVMMIDFGSDHDVTRSNLYREILYPNIPAFASKIKLARIHPKSGKWLSSDHDTLLDIITPRAEIKITGMSEDGIPLAEVTTDAGLNVNDEMIKLCPNLICMDDSRSLKSDDDDDAVVIVEEEDLSHIILPGTHVDTTDFTYNMEHIDEEELKMCIMAILSYNKIVLHKSTKIADRELSELGKEINHCAEFQPVIEDVRLGISCICRYSQDELYYRAQVYNVTGLASKYLSVYFVDFGNVEIVSVDDVKMMKPSWFALPVKCHLVQLNFALSSDIHSDHVYAYNRKLFGLSKTTKIVKRYPFIVDIYNEDGSLFYQKLIDDKLVTPLED